MKKILLLTLGSHQLGQSQAFNTLAECLTINWKAYILAEKGKELREMVQTFNPDLSFLQLQSTLLNPQFIKDIPGIKVNWTGDVREPIADYCHKYADVVDLTLFCNEDDVQIFRALGHKADFLDIGYDPNVFGVCGPISTPKDVVFFGNNYINRFPLSQSRIKMVEMLSSLPKCIDVGIYGKNWGDASVADLSNNTFEEAAIYRNSKIAINYSHFDRTNYSSDRVYRAMGCGCFCLAYHHKGIEKSFTPGVHLDTWKDFSELKEKILFWIDPSKEELRRSIANSGWAHVYSNHSWDNRVDRLKELIGWA